MMERTNRPQAGKGQRPGEARAPRRGDALAFATLRLDFIEYLLWSSIYLQLPRCGFEQSAESSEGAGRSLPRPVAQLALHLDPERSALRSGTPSGPVYDP